MTVHYTMYCINDEWQERLNSSTSFYVISEGMECAEWIVDSCENMRNVCSYMDNVYPEVWLDESITMCRELTVDEVFEYENKYRDMPLDDFFKKVQMVK